MSEWPDEPRKLTREEVYELVWSQSMRKLAAGKKVQKTSLARVTDPGRGP